MTGIYSYSVKRPDGVTLV